jgi:predicted acylesterase/phospholipase RssA
LAIDGGGIRGIVPGQILANLEAYLQGLHGQPGLRLADCFDMIAGTSTGGILTCVYLLADPKTGRPQFTAQQAVDLYLNHGDDIFTVPVFKKITSLGGLTDEKYSAAALEKTLSLYFGDAKLSQLLKPCVITSYDIAEREVVIFNSSDNLDGAHPDKDYLLRDVARATSAAPTYFEPANIRALDHSVRPLIDGGVFANNPSLCAFAEFAAARPGSGVGDVALLALGTGGVEKHFSFSEAKSWGAVEWVRPLIEITLSGVAEAVHYQLRQLFQAAAASAQYLRIDPELGPNTSPELDDASIMNMRRLKADGDRAYAMHREELESFARTFLAPPQPAVVAAQ